MGSCVPKSRESPPAVTLCSLLVLPCGSALPSSSASLHRTPSHSSATGALNVFYSCRSSEEAGAFLWFPSFQPSPSLQSIFSNPRSTGFACPSFSTAGGSGASSIQVSEGIQSTSFSSSLMLHSLKPVELHPSYGESTLAKGPNHRVVLSVLLREKIRWKSSQVKIQTKRSLTSYCTAPQELGPRGALVLQGQLLQCVWEMVPYDMSPPLLSMSASSSQESFWPLSCKLWQLLATHCELYARPNSYTSISLTPVERLLDSPDQELDGNEDLKAPFDQAELEELVRNVWGLLEIHVKWSMRLICLTLCQ